MKQFIEAVDYWIRSIEVKQIDMALLDFPKVFDCVQ